MNLSKEPTSLDWAIRHWHAAETEARRLKEAMTQVLRLQTGVSPQAKTIIRAALAVSVSSPIRESGK
jgi:hypothetical protein